MELAIVALIGTMCGGVGLKIVEHFLNKKERNDTLAAELREELRKDLADHRKELKEEARESEEWQRKFWEIKSELLIVNHKTNKTIQAVETKENHLGEDLKHLEYPGK